MGKRPTLLQKKHPKLKMLWKLTLKKEEVKRKKMARNPVSGNGNAIVLTTTILMVTVRILKRSLLHQVHLHPKEKEKEETNGNGVKETNGVDAKKEDTEGNKDEEKKKKKKIPRVLPPLKKKKKKKKKK